MLTTIVAVGPLYAYLDVDENAMLNYIKLNEEGKLASARDFHRPISSVCRTSKDSRTKVSWSSWTTASLPARARCACAAVEELEPVAHPGVFRAGAHRGESQLQDYPRARRGHRHGPDLAIPGGHAAHGRRHRILPGTSPGVVAETVATPIEQQVNGVENMLYMLSQRTSDGTMTSTITFKLGTDPNTAQVLVQNRVAIAEPQLPQDVCNIGVVTTKRQPDLLLLMHLVSPDGSHDALNLNNQSTAHLGKL